MAGERRIDKDEAQKKLYRLMADHFSYRFNPQELKKISEVLMKNTDQLNEQQYVDVYKAMFIDTEIDMPIVGEVIPADTKEERFLGVIFKGKSAIILPGKTCWADSLLLSIKVIFGEKITEVNLIGFLFLLLTKAIYVKRDREIMWIFKEVFKHWKENRDNGEKIKIYISKAELLKKWKLEVKRDSDNPERQLDEAINRAIEKNLIWRIDVGEIFGLSEDLEGKFINLLIEI